MKQLLKIGLTDGISSIMPIIMWYLIGQLFIPEYTITFSLTYYFQFVVGILLALFVEAHIIYEKKQELTDYNYTFSSIIVSVLLLIIINFIMIINLEKLFIYWNINITIYKEVYILSIIELSLEFVILAFKILLQIEEKYNTAFKIQLYYYILRVITVIIARLFTTDILLFCIINISLILIYTIYFLIYALKQLINIHEYKFQFKLKISSIKYKLNAIPSRIGLIIIYSLGLNSVTYQSASFLAAYNALSISSDTQWDILYAIDTRTNIEILNHRYEENKSRLFKESALYALILQLSTIIMATFLVLTNPDIGVKYLIVMLILEMGIFPVYIIKNICSTWLSTEYHGKWMLIISTVAYIIRTTLSIATQYKYSLNISLLVVQVLSTIAYATLYKIIRKQKNIS